MATHIATYATSWDSPLIVGWDMTGYIVAGFIICIIVGMVYLALVNERRVFNFWWGR